MTRTHVQQPVWAWFCDECGHQDHRLALSSLQLPTPDEMRAEGWFIARLWGDKCPQCNKKDDQK